MVIGSGLIATVFKDFIDEPNVVIFASGVSNSGEADKLAFDRELELIKKTIERHPNSLFVYFSTYSLEDPTLKDRPYGKHKLNMEKFISENAQHFIICRLTNIVGEGGNPNTIFNYLVDGIRKGSHLSLWQNATRNLLDVDDLSIIVRQIIKEAKIKNTRINIANPRNYTIKEIVDSISNYFNLDRNYNWIDQGSDVIIDIKETEEIVKSLNKDFSIAYISNLLEKYHGKR